MMEPPRYRTLDGDEVELPLAMDRWVLVPRTLARFDPELAWTLDYEDAPEPDGADPRLDFSSGALLVPVDRWNEHAAMEPNLAPCRLTSAAIVTALAPPGPSPAPGAEEDEVFQISVVGIIGRGATVCLAALAVGYVLAVTVWLCSLRHRVTGPDVSTGLLLVGAAVLLAWLAGGVGAVPRANAAATRARTMRGVVADFGHVSEHPLGILRLGLAIQLAGFVLLAALR